MVTLRILIFLFAFILLLTPPSLAFQQRSEATVNANLKAFEEIADKDPVFSAIKQVEPQEYAKFISQLREILRSPNPQKPAERFCSAFGRRMARKRQQYASSSALKRYLVSRLRIYEALGQVSEKALYVLVSDGTVSDDLSREEVKAIYEHMVKLSGPMVDIVLSPPSEKTVAQDDDLADRLYTGIFEKLSEEERQALLDSKKPNVNRAAFARAMIHVYREGLKLPDEQVVVLFRYVGELPLDPRDKKKQR